MPSGFRQEDYLRLISKNLFLASVTRYATNQNHLNNCGREPHKDHLCEIISKLDLGFRRRCHLSQLLMDDDGRKPITKLTLSLSDR